MALQYQGQIFYEPARWSGRAVSCWSGTGQYGQDLGIKRDSSGKRASSQPGEVTPPLFQQPTPS